MRLQECIRSVYGVTCLNLPRTMFSARISDSIAYLSFYCVCRVWEVVAKNALMDIARLPSYQRSQNISVFYEGWE